MTIHSDAHDVQSGINGSCRSSLQMMMMMMMLMTMIYCARGIHSSRL
jgi:hypothetical protein